jgi:DNA-binding transcriptional MerR regulator
MTQLWLPEEALKRHKYTEEDLLAAARELRCNDVRPRTIRTFVEQGLLAQPQRDWRGFGGGSSRGWWPRAQFDLWCTLLRQRKQLKERATRGSAQIHLALCNVVVSAWLNFGETAGIPLSQVRRAMRTWATGNRVTSLAKSRSAARKLVQQAAHSKAQDRRGSVDYLADVALTGRAPDREELYYQFQRLIDPMHTGAVKGPEEAPLSPDVATELIVQRADKLERLQQTDPDLPDGLWEWARYTYHWSRAAYEQAQPRLANDPSVRKHPELASMFRRKSFEDAVNTACADLLLVLAVSSLASQATHMPPQMRPELWIEGTMHARVSAEQTVSALYDFAGRRQAFVETTIAWTSSEDLQLWKVER